MKFTNVTSNFWKGALEGVWKQVNKIYEHWFFSGRWLWTVHGVLEFLKVFISLLLKMQPLDGCLLFCFLFCLLLLYPILIHQSVLRNLRIGKVDSWIWIIVTPKGFIIYQYHLLLWSITMHSFFVSWIGMTVCFLAASYYTDQRIMSLDDTA